MVARSILTHWGRVTHICVSILTIVGSDNGLSPGRRQAIIWTNAGILLIEHSRTKFSEILIEIQTFSFKKMHLKTSSAKWRPFCLGLNVYYRGKCKGGLGLENNYHVSQGPMRLSNSLVQNGSLCSRWVFVLGWMPHPGCHRTSLMRNNHLFM